MTIEKCCVVARGGGGLKKAMLLQMPNFPLTARHLTFFMVSPTTFFLICVVLFKNVQH